MLRTVKNTMFVEIIKPNVYLVNMKALNTIKINTDLNHSISNIDLLFLFVA